MTTFAQHITKAVTAAVNSTMDSYGEFEAARSCFTDAVIHYLGTIQYAEIDNANAMSLSRYRRRLQHVIGAVAPPVTERLVEQVWPESGSVVEAGDNVTRFLTLAYSLAEEYSTRYERESWQNVLLVLLSSPDHLDAIEMMTVDGEVLIPLVVAMFGKS